MYLLKKAQIAHQKADKTPIKVFSKYANFADVFSVKLAIKLSKYTRINNYTLKFVDDWQLSYSLIYSLGSIELETLKTYIKTTGPVASSGLSSFLQEHLFSLIKYQTKVSDYVPIIEISTI